LNLEIENKNYFFDLSNSLKKSDSYIKLRNLLFKLDYREIDRILSKFDDELLFKKNNSIQNLAMSWPEIIEISKNPLVTIGAHTMNHVNLLSINRQEAKMEILSSKLELEYKLCIQVSNFSYPFGLHKDESNKLNNLLEEIGFNTAVTTSNYLLFNKSKKNSYYLPRVTYNASLSSIPFYYTSGLISLLRSRFNNDT
jgi:peptidoglycan/xylan/chitin deacetylase (PgdA/CDA1 family)